MYINSNDKEIFTIQIIYNNLLVVHNIFQVVYFLISLFIFVTS